MIKYQACNDEGDKDVEFKANNAVGFTGQIGGNPLILVLIEGYWMDCDRPL